MRSSDCVRVRGKGVRECATDADTVGEVESRRMAAVTDTATDTAADPHTEVGTEVEAGAGAGAGSAGGPPSPSAPPCSATSALYVLCKQQQLDMRSRMRGNKALR